MPAIDLHTHSTASDGTLSPVDLVRLAHERGITTLGLTDHDSVSGLATATPEADRLGIDLIPGVELSCETGGTQIHLLGYFVDPNDPVFTSRLDELARQRDERAIQIVERLRGLGHPLTFQRVREIAGNGAIGRPHIARALIEMGVVKTVGEAFDQLLGYGRTGFVPKRPLAPADAIAMLRGNGAVPVLAHPFSTGDAAATAERLRADGLLGLEVYYGEYSIAEREELARIAARLGLVATGGSDFHGPAFKEGRELGSVPLPADIPVRMRQTWESAKSSQV